MKFPISEKAILTLSSLIRDNRGVSIIAAVAMMSILGIFGLLVVTLTVTETETSIGYLTSLQSMEIAQAGMEKAVYQYKAGTACNTLSYNNSLGAGSFATTGTPSGGSCIIQSTGTVGTANKVLQATVTLSSAGVAYLDGNSFAVSSSLPATTIGTLPTTLPAGDNLIIAVIAMRDTSGTADNIIAGDLKLMRGGATLASNQYVIRLGGGATPDNNDFQQETQFLVYRDTGVGANPTYDVTALAGSAGISAEVKMVVVNGVTNSSFQDGGVGPFDGTEDTILSHATTLPAGDNIIIAAVQLDNTSGSSRNVSIGNLQLKKGGATLASNEFRIDVDQLSDANHGTGVLLLYRDAGALANPTYTLTGIGSGTIQAEAKILVLNGLTSAFLDTGSVAVLTSQTIIGSLSTSFSSGDNVIIASNQFEASSTRNILAGDERMVESATIQASNELDMNLCGTGTNQTCNDFTDGLLWYQSGGSANPTFNVQAQRSAGFGGLNGETKILAFQISSGGPISISDWQELY